MILPAVFSTSFEDRESEVDRLGVPAPATEQLPADGPGRPDWTEVRSLGNKHVLHLYRDLLLLHMSFQHSNINQ